MNKIKGLDKLDLDQVIDKEKTRQNAEKEELIDNAIANRVKKIFSFIDKNWGSIDLKDESRWEASLFGKQPTIKDITRHIEWEGVQKTKAAILAGENVDSAITILVQNILRGHPNFYSPFLKAMAHHIEELKALRHVVGRFDTQDIRDKITRIVKRKPSS